MTDTDQLQARRERAQNIIDDNRITIRQADGDGIRAAAEGSADEPYEIAGQDGAWQCSCPTQPNTKELPCKHILAVQEVTRTDAASDTAIVAGEAGADTAISRYPGQQEWQLMQKQATVLLQSGILPDRYKKTETVVATMLRARELNLPPIYALQNIYSVHGNTCAGTELMTALVRRHGHSIEVVEQTQKQAVVEGTRTDSGDSIRVEFTMQDATNAGLTNKGVWKQYPQIMLTWRALSMLCRALFADCISGMSYTPEELGADVKRPDSNSPEFVVDDDAAPQSEQAAPEADSKDENVLEGDFEAERMDEPREPDEIGEDGKEELSALMRRLRDAGGNEDEIRDKMTETKHDWGVDAMAELSEKGKHDMEKRLYRYMSGIIFADGATTTFSDWQDVCDDHGLSPNEQEALQTLVLGDVRPPDSPDEMGELVVATTARMFEPGFAEADSD